MYKRLLVVVDDSEPSTVAVREGVRMAKSCGASIVFIHIFDSYVLPIGDWDTVGYQTLDVFEAKARERGKKLLARASAVATRAGVNVKCLTASGEDKAEIIAGAAVKHRCNLIIIGSHGRTTMQRLIQGSVVTHLITVSEVPILVCKHRRRHASKAGETEKVPAARRRTA